MVEQFRVLLPEAGLEQVGQGLGLLFFRQQLAQAFMVREAVNAGFGQERQLPVLVSVPGRFHIAVDMGAAPVGGRTEKRPAWVKVLDVALDDEHRGGIAHGVGVEFVAAAMDRQGRVVADSGEVHADLALQDILRPVRRLHVGDETVLPDHQAQLVAEVIKIVVFRNAAAAPNTQQLDACVAGQLKRPAITLPWQTEQIIERHPVHALEEKRFTVDHKLERVPAGAVAVAGGGLKLQCPDSEVKRLDVAKRPVLAQSQLYAVQVRFAQPVGEPEFGIWDRKFPLPELQLVKIRVDAAARVVHEFDRLGLVENGPPVLLVLDLDAQRHLAVRLDSPAQALVERARVAGCA